MKPKEKSSTFILLIFISALTGVVRGDDDSNNINENSPSLNSDNIPRNDGNDFYENLLQSEMLLESSNTGQNPNAQADEVVEQESQTSQSNTSILPIVTIPTTSKAPNRSEVVGKQNPGQSQTTLFANRTESGDDFMEEGPNLFTVTNTDVGFKWEKLPYREKYQWTNPSAPCRTFSLKVPDEKAEKSKLELCIYRPNLEFMDDTELFIHYVGGQENLQEQKELKVFGYVKGIKGPSSVYGKIVERFFYGEVSIQDPDTEQNIVYVVEQINILTKLMRYNEKILRNILYVMENGVTPAAKYNAVVTKGASLMNFMVTINPTERKLGSFLVFSTNHNSYITAGEPQMDVDETGKISFNAGGDKILIDPKGTVNLITRSRKYIFRPHGKTVVQEGISVDTLQEHEGSVAVSAFTSDSSYGCILPTPALSDDKKGGYVCKACLAVDNLFLKYFKSPTLGSGSPMGLLGGIIDQASWIFRSTDWNDDHIPDNVGISYDPQLAIWSYDGDSISGTEDLSPVQLDTVFASLSKIDFSDCCLGIAFTMKAFPEIMHAKSSRTTSPGLAGVCAVRTDGIYNNLLLISANRKDGMYNSITEDQLTYLTAHEIAKVFGAEPDGTGETACDQLSSGNNSGHYIMWPDVLRNASSQEKTFSSCAKKSILTSLTTCKSACFDIDKHPFCGNGIIEDGEECDCGSEYDCSQQMCCYSRIGKYPCRKTGVSCKTPSSSAYSIGTLFHPILLLPSILVILKTNSDNF